MSVFIFCLVSAAFVTLASAADIETYVNSRERDWYGGKSDESRVKAGGDLLALFKSLDYDVSMWMPNTFAQRMNNIFDKLHRNGDKTYVVQLFVGR